MFKRYVKYVFHVPLLPLNMRFSQRSSKPASYQNVSHFSKKKKKKKQRAKKMARKERPEETGAHPGCPLRS